MSGPTANSGSPKKSSLPPPPTLPSQPPRVANNYGPMPPPPPPPPLSGGLVLSSLPPPPTFTTPLAVRFGTTDIGVGSAAAPKSTMVPLPPPPIVSSSLPPPPVLPAIPAMTTAAVGENQPSAHSSLNDTTIPEPARPIHSTTERIPPLPSAPGSGISLGSGISHDEGSEHGGASGKKVNDGLGSYQTVVPGQTFQKYYAAAAPPPASQQPAQESPASGSSWTAWAGSLTTTAAPLAGTLLEKAGQLAYSTVETAADLVVGSGGSQGSMQGYDPNYNMGVDHGRPAAFNMLDGSPGGPASVARSPVAGTSDSVAKDNFANLFIGTSTGGQGSWENTMPTIASQSSEGNARMAEMMASPDVGGHHKQKSHQVMPELVPENAAILKEIQTPSQRKTHLSNRAAANPPSRTLANRQSRLSVLILPTADAQSIATRNNTTLSEMFRVFGNTRSSTHDVGNNTVRHGIGHVDSSLEPMLPPFRSANRSMALNWDNITLDFVSNQDMDNTPVSESVMEKGLGEAVRLWDEDRVLFNPYSVTGDNDAGGNMEEDMEMDQLEGYVVDALAQDEGEERIRKEDGIPSMSSPTPSRRNAHRFSDKDKSGESATDPFPPRPEEVLEESCAAAFALTALPTSTWLLRFRHTLDCATDSMHHEMLRNPSVVILAASTSEYSYLNCLAELANPHHLPRPYHDGRYDPNGLRREFLLLHDVINGPKDFDEARALSQMRDRFGYGCCSILRVNSLVPRSVAISDGYASAAEDTDWENFGPISPFVQNGLSDDYKSSLGKAEASPPARGACLSPTDKRAIRRYVANMVATGLVPAVERRIAHLNAAVTNAKKGVKNVIKSFWRKPIVSGLSGHSDNSGGGSGGNNRGDGNQNPDTSSSSGSVKYRFDSIESQTRLLADTLFLMRDYDAALSAYRLVKDDYKLDKAHLHYASVQEMIVLCIHCLDPSGSDGRYSSDVHHSIGTALYSYTLASEEEKESNANLGVRPGKAPYATRLATRLCLVLSGARSLCEGKHMEIADFLASASSHETPLGAAVLLEQSSAHYYRAGLLRKYAFHMLMAGHMFRSAMQERHAFRCFAASLYVYHSERWGELRSHLRSALAHQLYGMGRYALSMQFYAKLIRAIGDGRVSARSQQKFLTNIVNICKDHPTAALVAIDRMNENSDDNTIGSMPRNVGDALKGFTYAVREIEISNIGFPHVQDSSIHVCVDIAGDGEKGDESLWRDMMNCAEAELRASATVSSSTFGSDMNEYSSHGDDVPAPPMAHSGDEFIDKVITEIDKEEREAEYRERQKRKGKLRNPEIRATSEPLAVTFSLKNPLGLDIELTDMQLVATLSCSKLGLLHTNEFPVSSTNGSNDSMAEKSWTFHGSDYRFLSPQFLCQFPIESDDFSAEATACTIDKDSEPFFVVTKSSVKMGPNSDATISLNICPLVEGDLRILGVRFHLLGEIWIYHRFHLLGPLLQDTRDNRSRRVRGESISCRSKVEGKMPSLKVTVTPDEGAQSTVLQGQTRCWKLKVSNVGYAPANNIMLKTNGPWLHTTMSATRDEDAATSFCVGPSGTLMKVPFLNTSQSDVLHPGESIEIPVAIRTSGGGRQDFYLLFRYELWNENDFASSLVSCHRWARKLLSVTVYPSITMSASLMPSYSNNGEHILSVELMNYRSDSDTKLEMYLNKICIASRHFEIRQLLGQVDASDLSQFLLASVGNSDDVLSLKIGWQERVTLHYLVVPIEVNSTSVSFSTISFSKGDEMALESQPLIDHRYGSQVTDFMCLERAHEVFTTTLHSHRIEKERMLADHEQTGQPRHVAQIRRAKTMLEQESTVSLSGGQSKVSGAASHPTSLASLCPISGGGSNINIVCCWSAIVGEMDTDYVIYGQHHLRNLLVRPLNKSKGCPLALTAKYKPHVSHNFDEGPLDVDLEIVIRNRLIETDVDFEFAVDHQPEFDFVGMTCFGWSLLGGDELSIPLKARIYSGGVYNLQSVRLTVLSEGTSVPYLFPLQWTIVVDHTIVSS